MGETYDLLMSEANGIKIIDTHEHLDPYKNYIGDEPDVLCEYLSHYITSDLMSAGLKYDDLLKARDSKLNIFERFKILEPYLEYVKNTSYYRSLIIATSKLYGVTDISAKTIEGLNEKFKNAMKDENRRRYVMKDLCNIQVSINDCWFENDVDRDENDLFVYAWRSDGWICPEAMPESDTLGEYCEEYKSRFLKQIKNGMITLKSACAYWRSLYFEKVDYKSARELYLKAKQDGKFSVQLQDYMMHYVLKLADENDFIIQIHTGLQEGMCNNLENANPVLLKNLFAEYPNLTFDLFHIGYPYSREIITLAKYHHNVCIDMCWANIISPYASREFLNEALDVLPYGKIFGFGGDYMFFDGIYGHLTIAKQNICEVLADKTDRREISTGLSEKILYAVLHDNAARTFNIKKG